jgi:hypothetical protein
MQKYPHMALHTTAAGQNPYQASIVYYFLIYICIKTSKLMPEKNEIIY